MKLNPYATLFREGRPMGFLSYHSAQPSRLSLPADRIALAILIAYFLNGFAINILRSRPAPDFSILDPLYYFSLVNYATIFALIVYSVWRGQSTLLDWGFGLNKGVLVNIGLIILVILINHDSDSASFMFHQKFAATTIIGASAEEIIYRAWLITVLVFVMRKVKLNVLWAVLLATMIWFVPHIPTKTGPELWNIFTGGIIFCLIYYYTRSILFTMFFHVWSNTVGGMGIAGATIAGAAYFIIATIGHFTRHTAFSITVITEVDNTSVKDS